MKWQPIKTAPKDGTKIIGFPFFGQVCIAEFSKSSIFEDGWHVDASSQDGIGFYGVELTHWIELPEPPQDFSGDIGHE